MPLLAESSTGRHVPMVVAPTGYLLIVLGTARRGANGTRLPGEMESLS